jgi:transcriptional regulator with XRE-family HTH domain
MAAYLEVDTALVSKIERGERNASKKQVIQIAGFLKTNEEELLTLWLADKIESTIVEEPEIAYQALKIANKNFKNEKRNQANRQFFQRIPTWQCTERVDC